MKHIKLYENINQEIWVVIKNFDGNVEVDLFPDELSCQNFIIDIVNQYRENDMMVEEEIFTDYKSALEWFHEYYYDDNFYIKYLKKEINDHYKLDEKTKKLKNIRKYNL